MLFSRRLFAILIELFTLSSSAAAQSGRYGHSGVFNCTNHHIVIGFHNRDGGDWTGNWLSETLFIPTRIKSVSNEDGISTTSR
jgi:hypothetical protein